MIFRCLTHDLFLRNAFDPQEIFENLLYLSWSSVEWSRLNKVRNKQGTERMVSSIRGNSLMRGKRIKVGKIERNRNTVINRVQVNYQKKNKKDSTIFTFLQIFLYLFSRNSSAVIIINLWIVLSVSGIAE